jgi:ABC-type Fe3+/spermidine/putrescine transport system ATPase subunit
LTEQFLRLELVTKRFGDRAVVDRVSLHAAEGEILAMVGPSGCGKTTLLRLIAGLETPDEGEIIIGGRIAAAVGRNLLQPRERGIGFVFQDLALWPHMTIAESLEFVLVSSGAPKRDRKERIAEALRLTRSASFSGSYPHQISGGEQQRAALARALVANPQLLLLDEPTSSLDDDLKAELTGELLSLHRRLKITMVCVTHDRKEAASFANRIALMKDGRIESNTGLPTTEAKEYPRCQPIPESN